LPPHPLSIPPLSIPPLYISPLSISPLSIPPLYISPLSISPLSIPPLSIPPPLYSSPLLNCGILPDINSALSALQTDVATLLLLHSTFTSFQGDERPAKLGPRGLLKGTVMQGTFLPLIYCI
jgi:hypothetical protein